jgi:ABC-type nitrate/sulfonate/bicarbonate transport system substrate-binding protein
MTLKVGQIVNSIPAFPFGLAVEQNVFKAQGLTLDPPVPPNMGSGAKLATALEANGVEVAVGTINDAFTISRVDAHIKIIGAVSNAFLLDIVVTKRFEQQAHLTATSPLADKIHALVGKKIGISAPNSSTDALVTYLFRQQGLDAQKDVTKVSVGAVTATDLAVLQAGRVDAVVVGAPGGSQAEVQGIGDTFISPVRGDVPSMQGQLFGVVYAKQSVIDAKPKAIQAFIRGLAQAEALIQKNPTQATAYLPKYLKVDQKTIDVAWNATKAGMPATPQISQQAYDTANQFQVKAGLIAVPLAYNDLVASDLINNALNGMSS